MSESEPEIRGRAPLVSALLLAVCVVVSIWLVMGARRRAAPVASHRAVPADPLRLVPAGPRLVVSADIASLTKVAAQDLARLGGEKLLGLRETCGFEPLLSLKRAVLAMPFGDPQAASRGADFALIADTSIDSTRGLKCAELVIQKRGGTPGRTQLGAFTSVRDLKKPLGEVAMRSDGFFVLSGGQYFRDVLDAAAATERADEAAQLRTQLHRSLRDQLGDAQLVLTLLPEASSVLRGVAALGLALRVEGDLGIKGLVVCSSSAACATAREVIESTKTELANEPGLSGLAKLRLDARGDRIDLSGRMPREQLGPLLAQLLAP